MDYDKIKYISDKYYIRLDGFDLNNLNVFAQDATFSKQQAIYIHEYYHYLTNVTTFFGVRQFNCAFQDKVRLITILLKKAGLDAFPITSNTRPDCAYEVEYWKSIDKILDLDNLDKNFGGKVEKSPNKSFSIIRYRQKKYNLSLNYQRIKVQGVHIYYSFDIKGVPFASNFNLSDGMIDEFMNRSIDEFLFQHNMADNCDVLRAQAFYPYQVYDELLHYFGMDRVDSKLKIMVTYFCLHAFNPIDCMIQTLRVIRQKGFDKFEADPETFLLKLRKGNELNAYAAIVNGEKEYIDECLGHGRKNLADTMTLIYQKQYKAYGCLKDDFFYFIRPFLVENIDTEDGRKEFLRLFQNIRTELEEPILVQNKQMIDAGNDTYKNHLAMHIAIYEIFDSLTVNRIAKRIPDRKDKYEYPVATPDNDKLENLPDTTPLTETWHVALNDLSLYKLYMDEKQKLLLSIH